MTKKDLIKSNRSERGAALVTTMLVSTLLLTASVAMLMAVGANSRNTADMLSETKAYYAAESGIQASVNVLRNTSPRILYSDAAANPSLSNWLSYTNCTAPDGNPCVVVGAGTYVTNVGTAYQISVSDPDSADTRISFSTVGGITQTDGTYATMYFPDNVSANRTVVSWVPANQPVFDPPAKKTIGSFRVQKVGTGGTLAAMRFRIDYQMLTPRPYTRSLRGGISATGAVTFDSYKYDLMGGALNLCPDSTCTTEGTSFGLNLTIPAADSQADTPVYADIYPIQPYRLKIVATGYGPNGSRKQLEAMLQRDFINDQDSGPALAMVGSGNGLVFNPGTSKNVTYSGTDPVTGASVPSVAVTDSAGLSVVQANPPKTPLSPPAGLLGNEVPYWQQTPQALDAFLGQLKVAAQNGGTYYPSGVTPPNIGYDANPDPNITTWKGLTFADGNLDLTGNAGGILVVTGTLNLKGNFSFTGLIIVTGAGGVTRSGGGNGSITGSIVVAPYNATSLATNTFQLPPKYDMNGGGISDLTYGGFQISFDDIGAGTSNIIVGVAEK